ncbi:hypothetical protein Droror1_Dr00027866 [Drosera rotundifolia]
MAELAAMRYAKDVAAIQPQAQPSMAIGATDREVKGPSGVQSLPKALKQSRRAEREDGPRETVTVPNSPTPTEGDAASSKLLFVESLSAAPPAKRRGNLGRCIVDPNTGKLAPIYESSWYYQPDLSCFQARFDDRRVLKAVVLAHDQNPFRQKSWGALVELAFNDLYK